MSQNEWVVLRDSCYVIREITDYESRSTNHDQLNQPGQEDWGLE